MAQQIPDTVPAILPEVSVRAYEQNRELKEVAAPVAVINKQLQRFGNNTILPALNSAPGVRMEERSPGSYRLNIRGSSLRSPFGIRNVKVYLDGIPFTDPGGGTYLNQLSFFDINSIEVIKGPGSSLYGAGTGGVMLINSLPDSAGSPAFFNYTRGSFQTDNLHASITGRRGQFSNKLSYTHQESGGYRSHSAMRRDLATWQAAIKSSEHQQITAHVMYGNLFYETPGGLTLAQYQANPKAARPATQAFPGAEGNKAAIYQKTFRAGIQQQYAFNEAFRSTTSLYGAFSQVRNPAILNYERRSEPQFGGRATFSYSQQLSRTSLNIIAGAELQQGYFSIKAYKNNAGNTDSLRTDDEVNNRQFGVFTQASLVFPQGWIATAGLSLNKTSATFNRLSLVPAFTYKTSFNNEWAPRFSLLKKLKPQLSVYGVVSKGFSSPTVAELLPSTSVINTSLEAEHGINYEAGLRGRFFRNRLSLDISAYHFNLENAITQRRDLSGADFFVNAGSAKQRGIEASASYQLARNSSSFITSSTLWASYTFQHFRYKEFQQAGNDLSGNRIPGVAPNTLAGGLDIVTRPGIYASFTYYYSDHMALNDANAAYAAPYQLPGFKAGYRIRWCSHWVTDLFISGDNLLNQTYSLGNDINAAGNRFYNAAPGVNYQAGVNLHFNN